MVWLQQFGAFKIVNLFKLNYVTAMCSSSDYFLFTALCAYLKQT
ncbi:hypothetical protein PMAN_a1244 [Pseudoalteromonas marina]|nr:hypothetical protein PMAN_a1244 [Pseudoalteromonas marina]GAA76063.1 hypothetical protein P20480_2535 [Pseudoalteromonas sp. BSi20480]